MELSSFFKKHPKVAVAFSGGVDSAYLLYEAAVNCADVCAYYVKSAFQPGFELRDAMRLAKQLNTKLVVIDADVLAVSEIAANPKNRCYYCKKLIFAKIKEQAAADGYTVLLDGTNASDDAADRPGMRALEELSVLSPLRECGISKAEIRARSKEAGLLTWDKPAYACLATRIPAGTPITAQALEKTEKAEDYLFSLGFSNIRVRMAGKDAKIQLPLSQFGLLAEKREQVVQELKKYYSSVTLDLEARDE